MSLNDLRKYIFETLMSQILATDLKMIEIRAYVSGIYEFSTLSDLG